MSCRSIVPIIAPMTGSSGGSWPRTRRNAAPRRSESRDRPAMMATSPRYAVRQVRFSTGLSPVTSAQAQGWRTTRALMRSLRAYLLHIYSSLASGLEAFA